MIAYEKKSDLRGVSALFSGFNVRLLRESVRE
jgi:hypothetical protein